MAIKITIQTDADFTPPGKRAARVVTFDRGSRRIVWYVGGRRFRMDLAVTAANEALTQSWLAA